MKYRVLVAHNRYAEFPSGENQVVDGQIELLRSAGVEVETYFRSSTEIAEFSLRKRLMLGTRPVFSREDVSAVEKVIARFRPDVMHVHNVYPLISPAVVTRAQSLGCRVVQTIHNFRHVCPAGNCFRDGASCTACVGSRFPWPAVAHGCYRGSRPQSLALGTAIARHRNTWLQLDRFLPVSQFVADMLASAGVPRDKMCVVPNSVPDPGPQTPLGTGFLFVGRLSEGKGIGLLLDAWEQSGVGEETELTIVGDGPDRGLVEHAATRLPGVRYAGPVDRDQVCEYMRKTRCVVVSSAAFEALPTVVLESYACGRPVVATSVGPLEDLVPKELGWIAPADSGGLAEALRRSFRDPAAAAMGTHARHVYLTHYSQSAVLRQLLAVYRAVTASPSNEPLGGASHSSAPMDRGGR